MKSRDLLNRLDDEPFKPFQIHLSDGTRIDVPAAGMVIVGETSVVLPTSFKKDEDGRLIAHNWRTVALAHMVQFSDLGKSVNGKKRRSQ